MSSITVNTIEPVGSTLTVGSATDTVTVPTGATISGAISMVPAFEARITTEQNPSGGTDTLINFDSEVFDTNSAYDVSAKRFTVPSGLGGKYHLYCNLTVGSSANSGLAQCQAYVYKNGSKTTTRALTNTNNDGNGRYYGLNLSTSIVLSAGDYIEIYGRGDVDSGTIEVRTDESIFGMYRMIGV